MDKSQQAVEVFNRRASDYAQRYMDVTLYADTLDIFCDSLKPKARLLELACGPGNITRYLLDKRPDLDISATDLAPNMIAIASKNNPKAKFSLGDMRNLNSEFGSFDAILCGFGLPYLTKDEAITLIIDLPKMLNPGGIIYLSTMEGSYEASAIQQSSDGKDQMFIHFHEAGYLTDALQKAGFQIIAEKRQDFPAHNNIDLILIAQWNR